MKKAIKGYKCFNENFTCQNFKFEVGKTYKHDGEVELCKSGFHFCKTLKDVFSYYDFSDKKHVCEIEASGEVSHGDDKSVCGTIKIIREIPWDEVLKLANTGENNLGFCNAGNYNAGYGNAGNYNAGYGNAGNYNAGYGNAGNYNAGNYNAGNGNAGYGNAGNYNAGNGNAGYGNAGNGNAGNYNAGNGNAGYGNAGNGNAGVFNSKPGKLRMFNKETNVLWEDERLQAARNISVDFQEYVYFSDMTEKEKKEFPYAKTTGGYFKQLGYKEGWIKFWGNASESTKKVFLNLPNFDAKVFKEITGIKV